MITITITQDTFAKQSTAPALTLPKDKICFLKAGTVLKASACQPCSANHLKVTLVQSLEGFQTWLIYAQHCTIAGALLPKPNNFALNVPYYSQRDNAVDWWRTCNTSSCAMAAEYLKPGCIKGSDDYYYANYVQPEGDTTDHAVQTRALARLGIQSDFFYNLDYADLDHALNQNCPIVIGVLHKGTISSPYGGHMLVVIGKYADGYIVNDPWGEGFDYVNTNGKAVKYPYKSLDGRWLAGGKHSGWGRLFAA